MKFAMAATVFLALIGSAFANGGNIQASKFKFADASSDACVAGCSTQNASCKRTCSATFNTPCLNACDSQAQTCMRGCQTR
jgi:hypothetical protein